MAFLVDIEDGDKIRRGNFSPNDDKIKDTRFNRDNIDTTDLRQQILTTFCRHGHRKRSNQQWNVIKG